MNRIQKIWRPALIIVVWLSLALWAWAKPSDAVSQQERRQLSQFPELTAQALFSGEFAEGFEDYALDQFPARNIFRTAKSVAATGVFLQSDTNGIYFYENSAIKMEYPENTFWIENAKEKFQNIYDLYLKEAGTNNYISIIPDKNYYASDKSEHLRIDYEELFEKFQDISWAEYVDITNTLSLESFYSTDLHWRQEWLMVTAETLCSAMGTGTQNIEDLTPMKVSDNFYGVYYGQAALPMQPDDMYVVFSDLTENAQVYDYETGKTLSVYNEDGINSKDMYDYFLHGAKALLRIDNPAADSEKELVVFRDSFGSSIVPLMMKDYKTIYLIDIRYINSSMIGNYVEFNSNQDVLFLYSTTVINNSSTFK